MLSPASLRQKRWRDVRTEPRARSMGNDVYEEVMWSPWSDLGLEHALMVGGTQGVRVTGLVMRMPGLPAGFRYVIDVDGGWSLRRIALEPLDRPGWTLLREQDGTWRNEDGGEVPMLRGCSDVELSVTPLTNTLILRRLDLAIDESVDVCVAHVTAPELRLRRREQRYFRTGERAYRLQDTQGESEFFVDDETVVLDWPGRYRRVWTADKEARRRDLERQVVRREQLLRSRKEQP